MSKMSAFFCKRLGVNSKENSNLGWMTKSGGRKKEKSLCGCIKTENLIESTCFHLKTSRVHVFCSNFSQVLMFCDDNIFEISTRVYAAREFSEFYDCQ